MNKISNVSSQSSVNKRKCYEIEEEENSAKSGYSCSFTTSANYSRLELDLRLGYKNTTAFGTAGAVEFYQWFLNVDNIVRDDFIFDVYLKVIHPKGKHDSHNFLLFFFFFFFLSFFFYNKNKFRVDVHNNCKHKIKCSHSMVVANFQ